MRRLLLCAVFASACTGEVEPGGRDGAAATGDGGAGDARTDRDGGGDGDACVVSSCAALGFDCGVQDVGCGRMQDCGACAAPATCGGGALGAGRCGGPLKYFGYWRDSDLQNFVCQLQDHANFSMTSDGQSIVDEAAMYGVANFGFTAPTKGTPAPLGAAVVRDDADVSAWGWCSMNPCPNGIADGWAAVKSQIESDGATVLQQHPNAHLMINLGDGNGDGKLDFQGIPGFTLPKGIDWVGLECYTGAADCKANFDLVKTLLPAGGRIWVLPAGETEYGTEQWLVDQMQANYDWASVAPEVIGVMVFVWSKAILCPPSCSALAVKELPNLLAKCRAIGDAITGRGSIQPIPDNMCPPP